MEDLDPISKTLNLRLTPVLKKLFGDDIIDKIRSVGLRARDVFELVLPQQQCRAVIGSNIGADCWICGIEISKKVKRAFHPKSKPKSVNLSTGLTAECEHVLPIAQAVILLQLYNPTMKPIMHNPDQVTLYEMLQHEYEWAHIVCNQEKNDMCPIQVKANGTFGINETQIHNLLTNINKSNRGDSKLLKGKIRETYGTTNNFVNTRGPLIVRQYQNIINFLQKVQEVDSPENKRFSQLIVFAGIAGLSDKSIINPALHDIIDTATIKSLVDSLEPLQNFDLEKSKKILEIYQETKSQIKKFNLEIKGSRLPHWNEYAQLNSFVDIAEEDDAGHYYKNNLFDFISHLSGKYDEFLTDEYIKEYPYILGLYIIYRAVKEINQSYIFDDETKSLYKRVEDLTYANLPPGLFIILDEEYNHFENIEINYAAGILTRIKGNNATKKTSKFNPFRKGTIKPTRKATKLILKRHAVGKTVKRHNVRNVIAKIHGVSRTGRPYTKLKAIKG